MGFNEITRNAINGKIIQTLGEKKYALEIRRERERK